MSESEEREAAQKILEDLHKTLMNSETYTYIAAIGADQNYTVASRMASPREMVACLAAVLHKAGAILLTNEKFEIQQFADIVNDAIMISFAELERQFDAKVPGDLIIGPWNKGR